MATITSGGLSPEQTYAAACVDMIGVFQSCTSKIDGFTGLPFKEQASCYCCRTSRGSVAWTDEIDNYATTCADWAITGEPKTAYLGILFNFQLSDQTANSNPPVAKTFETFCEQYTDVCGTSETASESSFTTDDAGSETDASSSQNTITVTGKDGTDNTGSVIPSTHHHGLSTGAIAGIAAGAGVIALLILAGIFLWCWKRKRYGQDSMGPQQMPPTQQFNNNNGQQQPIYVPHAQQSPDYGNHQFSPMHPANNMYQTSPPATAPWPPPGQPVMQPAGQTHFVAELPALVKEAVEVGSSEIKH
ncbi:hypothetical protein NW762_003917 [Fusarium torreyae]|uniref:Uncharacterized protein n=1 Tax=Fusarium torreyae TaxID=1237075 RepID=A0A9W8S5Q9_9HYPO|nr:hypothetical protein NW762_003917 [Fusarium torreyae]